MEVHPQFCFIFYLWTGSHQSDQRGLELGIMVSVSLSVQLALEVFSVCYRPCLLASQHPLFLCRLSSQRHLLRMDKWLTAARARRGFLPAVRSLLWTRGLLFLRSGFILTFLVSSLTTALALRGRVIPAPSPHLAHIWRLLEESVCNLAWPSWPFYLFFINHPLPPPELACPAPLNRLQFVSGEWCRALPARPGVAVLRLEGKEGPSPICSQAPLPAAPLLGSAGCSPSSFLTEQSLSIYFLSFVLKCQVGRPRLCHGLSPGTCAGSLRVFQALQKELWGRHGRESRASEK